MGSKARAEVEISASDSKLAAGLSRARTRINSWAATVERGIGKLFDREPKSKRQRGGRDGGGVFGQALGHLGGEMMARGIDAMKEGADEVRDFERSLVRFQINARQAPEFLKGFRDGIMETSAATGIAREAVLAGAQTYLDLSGDVKGAATAMNAFARVSQASGTSMDDVARAAYALKQSMGIDASEFESTFSGLISQGKAGAVTLKDLAGEFPALLSQFRQFGVVGREGAMQVGAMMQVGLDAFPTAAEAATGMAGMMNGLGRHAKDFQKAGVQIYKVGKDGAKTFRPMAQIIDDIGKSKLAKDPSLLIKAFGRVEGMRFYKQLAASVDKLHEMEIAGHNTTAVPDDLKTFLESDAGRLDAAMNRLKLSIAAAFTPERIAAFTTAVDALVTKLGPVISAIANVADLTLGKLVGAGKSIRGAFAEDMNPWQPDKGGILGAETDDALEAYGLADNDPRKKALLMRAGMRRRNHDAFETAKDQILGAEVGDRSSPASIAAALRIKYAPDQTAARTGKGMGPAGSLGAFYAADNYLKNAGVTPEQQTQLLNEQLIAQLKKSNELLNVIAGKDAKIQIGNNEVAKGAANAAVARNGVKKS